VSKSVRELPEQILTDRQRFSNFAFNRQLWGVRSKPTPISSDRTNFPGINHFHPRQTVVLFSRRKQFPVGVQKGAPARRDFCLIIIIENIEPTFLIAATDRYRSHPSTGRSRTAAVNSVTISRFSRSVFLFHEPPQNFGVAAGSGLRFWRRGSVCGHIF
jgi:hypothetical protein